MYFLCIIFLIFILGGFILKILSIDTASNICSVAILEDKNLIKEISLDDLKTHSEKLMPMIEEIFSKTNLSLKDIDLIICDKGPGSFTGIRIGVATAMSFTDTLNIPAIGVSSLEALVYNEKQKGLICSLIDANNSNVYFSLYELKENTYSLKENYCCENINIIIEMLKKYDLPITFVGDGVISYMNLISENLPNSKFSSNNYLSSYSLGLAGYSRYMSNDFQDLLPLYLRKSQAERALEEKNNANTNN